MTAQTGIPKSNDPERRRFDRLTLSRLKKLEQGVSGLARQNQVNRTVINNRGGGGSGSVEFADLPPEPLAPVASPGVVDKASRRDHRHPMPSASDVGADPEGTAAAAVTDHEGQPNPHPQYAAISTAVAGESIGGHRAVYISDSGVAFYASSDAASAAVVAGISILSASTGTPVSYRMFGEIHEPSWNWTPELPIYLGLSGLLTQTPVASGWNIVLGLALTDTSMIVRIGDPIELA